MMPNPLTHTLQIFIVKGPLQIESLQLAPSVGRTCALASATVGVKNSRATLLKKKKKKTPKQYSLQQQRSLRSQQS